MNWKSGFPLLSLIAIVLIAGCADTKPNASDVADSGHEAGSEAGSAVGGGAPMYIDDTEESEDMTEVVVEPVEEPVIEAASAAVAPAIVAPVEVAPDVKPAAIEMAEETASVEAPAIAAPAVVAPVAAAKAAAPADSKMTGDWSMWGGHPSRNMVNPSTGISLDFDVDAGTKVKWTAPLGSQTYGNPVVAGGKVFVGTNNGGEYRPQHKGDRGCLIAFNEADGKFLWQLTREKLAAGRVNDWPEQGICSTPCVENGRLYVATNRCELMCIDVEGFYDGENDGPYKDEVDTEEADADIIWSLDMIDELGVFPHNLATSSPVIHGDLILLVTSNGVDEAHLEVPSPRAPCFIAVNKNTGELVWEDNSPALDSKAPAPFDNILHGQWGSPAVGTVNGQTQVYMPGGDGVLYAYDIESGDLVWWFDLNPKTSTWELGGRGTRNAIISTPVFHEDSVLLAVGQDPEHGEGVGHFYRIDATKKGDVSPQIADGDTWKDNPNSGKIWEVGGVDKDGSITGEENGLIFRRTISTAAVADGLVYAPDLSGFLHCIDFKTGEKKWVHDTFAAVWGSPMVVDGHVLLGDEDGEMVILKAGPKEEEIETKTFNSSIYSTPSIANGMMYVSDRSTLYAIEISAK